MHTKLIGTFGLNEAEITFIRRHLPQKECEIMVADNVTDIIAVSEFAVIVRFSCQWAMGGTKNVPWDHIIVYPASSIHFLNSSTDIPIFCAPRSIL